MGGASVQVERNGTPGASDAGHAALRESDLAELLGTFNEVTAKLQATHETLRGEVARLEAELREANGQLERSRRLAALGEMAAGIAHEVRNPLGSIGLYARMLEQDLADRAPEREIAGKIALAVRGVDAVVTDVLAFAKEITVRPATTDTDELLTRAVAECAGMRGWGGVEVRRLDAGRPPVGLACDIALLHRALVNVIRNAVEAMTDSVAGSGGARVLMLDAVLRPVRSTGGDADAGRPARGRTDGMAVLWVRDTGPGVTPDVMERMFNPFFTTRASGTGLGLPIVHRIVDAHGGRISVRNHPEGGAVVELMMPAGAREGKELSTGGARGGGESGSDVRSRSFVT